MNRRDDIRAAMQSLLCSNPFERRGAILESHPSAYGAVESRTDFPMSGVASPVLEDLRTALHDNGIEAQPQEIAQALFEALAARPSLCRGLLAAYLVEG